MLMADFKYHALTLSYWRLEVLHIQTIILAIKFQNDQYKSFLWLNLGK